MSLRSLALLLLPLVPLPVMGATLEPETAAPAQVQRGLEQAEVTATPVPLVLRAPPFPAPQRALTRWRDAPAPVAPETAALSPARPGTDVVQLPLPGAMPLLLGALAGFAILGRRRSRPPRRA